MTEERLAEIKKLIEWQRRPYEGQPERRIVAVTAYNEIVPELVEEVERLQASMSAQGLKN